MIVVDEAHHTLAPSYRRIIKAIRDVRPEAKLLGLTATPVRMTDNATKALMRICDNKIIDAVTMSELIANGTLSTPNYISRQTNVDIEAIIDIDERKYIKKWGELPESLLKSMKSSSVSTRRTSTSTTFPTKKTSLPSAIIWQIPIGWTASQSTHTHRQKAARSTISGFHSSVRMQQRTSF